MKTKRSINIALKVCTALLLAIALLLTFTVSDYYIFNRFHEFNAAFILSQWLKKAGLLLIPLAVFYNRRSCADIAKYLMPVAAVLSCCLFGGFFDITMLTEGASAAEKVYASINEFMPKPAHMSLFFISSGLYIVVSALLFARDGVKVKAKSFIYLPLAFLAVTPLNIFENFFDISSFPQDSFLRFKNFSVWHFLALAVLAGFTIAAYYILKRQSKRNREDLLVAMAIVLLVQYHSKNSMIMGDGYNVYHTIFACVPLFICNIGVYVVSLSVILKKRVLYALAFFVHAAGALSIFVYFGNENNTNFGIIGSYSILFFCITHCILFSICVLPSALGQYRFKLKDCIFPLIYYVVFVISAAVASGLVTSASMSFSFDGYTLQEGDYLYPNYAFTQISPIEATLPVIPLKIWRYEFNVLYLIILYAVYVGIFWTFIGAYYAFLALRKKVICARKT